MKPVPLLALLLAFSCAPAPAQDNEAVPNAALPAAPPPAADAGAEQQAIMDRIERDVRLPEGAGPLSGYTRYYAWQERGDGVRKVIGVYLGVGERQPGRHWVAETSLPLIMDGGCGLVTLSYNVAEQRIEHISCNGEA